MYTDWTYAVLMYCFDNFVTILSVWIILKNIIDNNMVALFDDY